MPPRKPAKVARSKGARSSPTPASSQATGAVEDPVDSIDIASLTLDVPLSNKPPLRKKRPVFRFMDLPMELRIKIYGYHFASIDHVIDLEPGNYNAIHKKLSILRVCRQIYLEASDAFYSSKTFRIFPTDGRHTRTKKGLLARMKPRPRASMTTLELRLGPGFSQPYRCWVVNDQLGLQDCVNVRRLCIHIEIDPSDNIFNGWRPAPGFYESFCQKLLDDVLTGLTNVRVVQFDAEHCVKKSCDMVQGLLEVAKDHDCQIAWGPIRGWTGDDDDDEVEEDQPPLSSILPVSAGALDFSLPSVLEMAQEVIAQAA